MKAISLKTLVFFALAANMALFSCSKKSDPTPTANNNSGSNNGSTNSVTFISKTDTVWTAAGDSGSRTFLNGTDAQVYTATQVGTNKIGSTIVFGYNFNNDTATYAACIMDAQAFPVQYNWYGSAQATNFKTVSLGSANFDTLSLASVVSLYNNSSATAAAFVSKVKEGQVIVFQYANNTKYGILKVNKIVTTWSGTTPSPYATYLAYSLRMEE